jgi:hypothetical protein
MLYALLGRPGLLLLRKTDWLPGHHLSSLGSPSRPTAPTRPEFLAGIDG